MILPLATPKLTISMLPPTILAFFGRFFRGIRMKCCVSRSPKTAPWHRAAQDQTIRVWDTENTKERFIFQDTRSITALAFSADGKKLAAGDAGMRVTVWNVATGVKVATLEGLAGPIRQLALSGDGAMAGAVRWDSRKNLGRGNTQGKNGLRRPIRFVA